MIFYYKDSKVVRQKSPSYHFQPSCKRLWCTTSEGEAHGCRTQHMPWADGTACGPNKWCMKSECVVKTEKPSPVQGQWGEWSRYATDL